MPEKESSQSGIFRAWPYFAIALVACILTGGLIAWLRFTPGPPLEIKLKTPPASAVTIYIGGAVMNPGYYPVRAGDTLDDLLKSAGGVTDNGSLDHLQLRVAAPGETDQAQRVNINRAPAWLLQALPGIGEARAQGIIRYREKNGYFRSTADLMRVDGIGAASYERLKDLITVGD